MSHLRADQLLRPPPTPGLALQVETIEKSFPASGQCLTQSWIWRALGRATGRGSQMVLRQKAQRWRVQNQGGLGSDAKEKTEEHSRRKGLPPPTPIPSKPDLSEFIPTHPLFPPPPGSFSRNCEVGGTRPVGAHTVSEIKIYNHMAEATTWDPKSPPID